MSGPARARVAAACETISAIAVAAWVGGHAALGAFGARILFRDLPRDVAAATMTTVFRSFDSLILVAAIAVAVATLARAWAVGVFSRGTRIERADAIATFAAVALVAVALVELGWAHPAIERLYRAGASASVEFASLHRASERLGHAEAALGAVLFGSFAWRRARA